MPLEVRERWQHQHRCATESQWPGWEFWYGSRSNDALAAVMALQHGSKKQEDAGKKAAFFDLDLLSLG
jgi:hypothetical protein